MTIQIEGLANFSLTHYRVVSWPGPLRHMVIATDEHAEPEPRESPVFTVYQGFCSDAQTAMDAR
jgi:hypothetical protein